MAHNPESKEYVTQLAQAVVTTRIRGGIPNNFTFNPNTGKLLFLSSTFTSNLHYVNIADATSSTGEVETLSPQLVIRSEALSGDHKFTKEELLLRERQRLTETGVTAYFPTSDGEKILIPSGSQLCVAERKGDHFVVESAHQSPGAMDPKWSPDGNLISFVRNSDIWILDLNSKTEHQITSVHAEDNLKSAGESKFIMQEEFDRYTGYWWSPVASKEYNILYLVEDEQGITNFGIPQPSYTGEIDNYLYPLAGGKNTTFEVWVATFSLTHSDSASSSISVKKTNIFPQLRESFSWCEYVVRAGWMPSGKSAWVQLVDRKQQHLALVELSLDTSLAPKILFEEHSDVWINVTDIIHIFDDNRIIWASEMTGFRHLYMLTPSPNGGLYTATPITSVSPPSLSSIASPSFSSSSSSLSFSSSSVSSHPPSEWESEWCIPRDPQLHVDEKRQLVYFLGLRDSPLEPHLYVASYAQGSKPSEVIRLTPLGASHSEVTVSPDSTSFVVKSSSVSTQPQTTIYSLKFDGSAKFPTAIPKARIASALPTNPFPANPPHIFSFLNKNGVKLFGCYFLPQNYDPSLKYRTLVRVYGGPHVQLVSNSYEITNQPEIQMYLALGFICVIIDNTGSNNRGLKFEGVLRTKMGTIEISDQVDGIEYLISQGIGIDKARIGVTGWSYGGYLSLMAICQRPDIFRVSIPKCPVVLWEAYDTGYTERYMDIPPNSGYHSGSVLTYINTFPDDDNRLLLVHGLQDENVHFSNTVQLIDGLIGANKPHQTLLLPKERHGCANSNTRRYLLVQCALFFLKNM